MNEKEFFTGPKNPFNIGRCIAYNLQFARDNPDYFDPDGIWCFVAARAAGRL